MFDGGDHQVLHVFAGNATGCRDEAHGLRVAAIEGEGDANALTIVATDLEPVGAPAAISLGDSEAAIMSALLATDMALEQQAVLLHHPPDALMRWPMLPRW